MSEFSSPFVQQIKSCKSIMRKLRKKIYKHTVSHKNIGKKTKDNPQAIMDILYSRQIPNFIIESLKKRRNFDLLSVKNIVVNKFLTYDEIRKRTNDQQQQIKELYESHKVRMNQIKTNSSYSKSQKLINLALQPSRFIYSSTEEEQLLSQQKSLGYQQRQMQFNHNQFEESMFEKLSSSKNQCSDYNQKFQLMNGIQNQFEQDLFLFNF